MENHKSKNTAFLFFGILALLALAGACVYYILDYHSMIQSYIELYIPQGYTEEMIKSSFPFSDVVPTLIQTTGLYSLLAAVLFGANSIVKRMGIGKSRVEKTPSMAKVVEEIGVEKQKSQPEIEQSEQLENRAVDPVLPD
jgi:hypothetical protein